MRKYLFTLLLSMVLFFPELYAQEKEVMLHTMPYDSLVGSPEANLKVLGWIAGHWQGEAFGGITEEVWTPPLGGSMMCTFKLVVNGKISFYEFVTISEENNTLIMRLKHFDSGLVGWEEKDKFVEFKLVKVTNDKVYFDEFTFERVGEDEINIYVVIENQGKTQETKFNYKRVKD